MSSAHRIYTHVQSSNKRQSWSDAVILLLLADCSLIVLKILKILTFWNHEYVFEVSVFILGLICKVLMTVMNSVHWKIEKFTVLTILGIDFVLMLYHMGFKYSSQAQSDISNLRLHSCFAFHWDVSISWCLLMKHIVFKVMFVH